MMSARSLMNLTVDDLVSRLALFLAISVSVITPAFGQPSPGSAFVSFVTQRIEPASSGKLPEKFCPVDQNRLASRVFAEYGAMFVASNDVRLPPVCCFPDEASVAKFQSTLKISSTVIDGAEIRLQAPAMTAFLKTIDAARQLNVRIAPLDGSIAAARTYSDTENIWNSRYRPALRFWISRGMIQADAVDALGSAPLDDRVEHVIDWESQGMLFGTGRRSSIFSSTAPPGASQHLSLIAFDASGPITPLVTALFNANGWFQTVKGDPAHFTYLGVFEGELPKRGLRQIYYNAFRYWVPDLAPATKAIPQD